MLLHHSNLIFDLGVNDGSDTEFYLRKGFSVVGVEANPNLVDAVKKKYHQQIADGKLVLLHRAVSQVPGSQDFFINNKDSGWSSLDYELGNRSFGCTKQRVKTITLRQLVDEYGIPYYLKIDIEGEDYATLREMVTFDEVPPFVSFENPSPEIIEMLAERGYDQFKIVSQELVQIQKLPNPALEGSYVAHKFQFRSSGAFGNETPGNTYDVHEAKDIAERIRYLADEGLLTFWYDVHARFKGT